MLCGGAIGCTCDENVECPPLTQNSINFLERMIEHGDTINYVNADSEMIQFYGKNFWFTLDNLQPCKAKETFKCNCDYPCQSTGEVSYRNDSTTETLSYSIREEWYKGKMTYSVISLFLFDWSTSYMNPEQPGYYSSEDTLFATIQIDGHTYHNVRKMSLDTTAEYLTDNLVWRTYFSVNDGLIAFMKRPSQKLYVRQ